MATACFTPRARDDLEGLIESHNLPSDTRQRIRRSLVPLGEFPQLGVPLTRRWDELRFVLGPWRWLVIVYRWNQDADRVEVLALTDARASNSPTTRR